LLAALVLGMAAAAWAQHPENVPPTEYMEPGNEITKPSARDLEQVNPESGWSGTGLAGAALCLLAAAAAAVLRPEQPLPLIGRNRRYLVLLLLLAAVSLVLLSLPRSG
jgi:hypothetical protein